MGTRVEWNIHKNLPLQKKCKESYYQKPSRTYMVSINAFAFKFSLADTYDEFIHFVLNFYLPKN
jgi:hypothetical protein